MHAIIARLNADKLKATPHVVPQPGLLRTVMGDDAFLAALNERRRWIAQHCYGAFRLGNIKDDNGELTGKSYCFADQQDAFAFRLRF
ncbi:hypothetical protein [Methylorubrum aminovorans]